MTKGVPGGGGGEDAATIAAGTAALLSSAADEVDDLEFVAFVERGLSPAVARHDVAIQFHGHAISFHAEGFQQRGEGKRCRSVAEIPLFPIDLKFHDAEAGNLVGYLYSALRSTNFRVAVRPS